MDQQRIAEKLGGARALARKASLVLTLVRAFRLATGRKGADGGCYFAAYLMHI